GNVGDEAVTAKGDVDHQQLAGGDGYIAEAGGIAGDGDLPRPSPGGSGLKGCQPGIPDVHAWIQEGDMGVIIDGGAIFFAMLLSAGPVGFEMAGNAGGGRRRRRPRP